MQRKRLLSSRQIVLKNSVDSLRQQLISLGYEKEFLNECLNKATTDEEKVNITEKIKYLEESESFIADKFEFFKRKRDEFREEIKNKENKVETK